MVREKRTVKRNKIKREEGKRRVVRGGKQEAGGVRKEKEPRTRSDPLRA